MRALLGLAATRAATHVFVVLTLVLGPRWATSLSAQNGEQNGSMAAQGPANYPMASRFAPYKISTLLHTTSLQPNWINGGDRFWYQWETSAGRSYYVVDPVRATRTLIFDNDRIAAELTRITRDPWDGQHLPIR